MTGFLSALLYQLVKAYLGLVKIMQPIYEDVKAESVPTWSRVNIQRALDAIGGQSSVVGSVCLFLDGLDECEGERGDVDREDLQTIVDLLGWKSISFKVCIGSRAVPSIETRFKHFRTL